MLSPRRAMKLRKSWISKKRNFSTCRPPSRLILGNLTKYRKIRFIGDIMFCSAFCLLAWHCVQQLVFRHPLIQHHMFRSMFCSAQHLLFGVLFGTSRFVRRSVRRRWTFWRGVGRFVRRCVVSCCCVRRRCSVNGGWRWLNILFCSGGCSAWTGVRVRWTLFVAGPENSFVFFFCHRWYL